MEISQYKEISILHNMVENIGRSIEYGEGRLKTIHKKRDSYNYIPQSTRFQLKLFTKAFTYLLRNRKGYNEKDAQDLIGNLHDFTFLDAGCGPGLTLALARAVGFRKTIGLELDPKMVKMAKTLNLYHQHRKAYSHTPNWTKIVQTDICTSIMYKHADVVYFYVPMKNEKWQRVFELQVANTIKIGTLVIPTGSSTRFRKDLRFENVGNTAIFVKTSA